ncbi:MAG: hypothetical protein ACPG31_04900 [Planctomycetota bacterium]
MEPHPRPLSLAGLCLTASLCLLGSCGDTASVDTPIDLSLMHVSQVSKIPGGLPPAWAEEFDAVIAGAPTISMKDPRSMQVVRDLLTQVRWIDPRSIEVALALPEGVRVSYLPKMPRLVLAQGEEPQHVIAEDGTLLPDGLDMELLRGFFYVSIDAQTILPEPGGRCADPVVQEAFRLWGEADSVMALAELPVVAIQKRSDYPRHTTGMAPAMSFILSDGTEICWGRAKDTPDPHSVDRNGKRLSMERKTQRLILVLREYPQLQGVSRLVLDDPLVKAFDRNMQPLPLPDTIQ